MQKPNCQHILIKYSLHSPIIAHSSFVHHIHHLFTTFTKNQIFIICSSYLLNIHITTKNRILLNNTINQQYFPYTKNSIVFRLRRFAQRLKSGRKIARPKSPDQNRPTKIRAHGQRPEPGRNNFFNFPIIIVYQYIIY